MLPYARKFDENKGPKMRLKIFFEMTDSGGTIRVQSEEQVVRIFEGIDAEELLYTVDEFLKIRDTMQGFTDDMLLDEFQKILSHDSREMYIQLRADNNYVSDREGFDTAILNLIETIVGDLMAKESMLSRINRGEWRKPKDVEVSVHHKRYGWLMKCVDRIPTNNPYFLEEGEIKHYYKYTFPNSWVLGYEMARPVK